MCPHGQVFVLGCREGQEGAGVPPNTKKTRCVAFFSCHGVVGGAGEGREAAEHKERTHMGTFFVFGCRRTALARKSCWGQGWSMRAAEHEKNATHRVFFMSWGGGQVRAGSQIQRTRPHGHVLCVGLQGTTAGAGEPLDTKNT